MLNLRHFKKLNKYVEMFTAVAVFTCIEKMETMQNISKIVNKII